MRRFLMVAMAALAAATLAACSHSSLQQSMLPSAPQQMAQEQAAFDAFGPLNPETLMVMGARRFRACAPAPRGYETCYAIMSTAQIHPDAPNASSSGCNHKPGCYLPSDLQGAYGVTSEAQSGGKGVTIAIVDAYGYTKGYKGVSADVALYRKLENQPACGSGCLKVVNQTGGSKLPPVGKGGNSSWQAETALDLDMISAICPNCNIVLVQANSALDSDLAVAEATALRLGTVVTNSFGAQEQAASYALFDSHPGKVIVASAGDDGAGVPFTPPFPATPEAQPCGFTGVVCVGGTSLIANNGRYVSEKVWQDFDYAYNGKHYNLGATGSGCSAMVAKPSWQKDKGCKKRSATDISADADPITGVAIACTPCEKLYSLTSPYIGGIGGTSASSPMIAAMYALAGNAGSISSAPQKIWTSGKSNFHDVTKGYNDGKHLNPPLGDNATATGLFCKKSIAYICKAGKGYDGPTGWGSPKGLGAF